MSLSRYSPATACLSRRQWLMHKSLEENFWDGECLFTLLNLGLSSKYQKFKRSDFIFCLGILYNSEGILYSKEILLRHNFLSSSSSSARSLLMVLLTPSIRCSLRFSFIILPSKFHSRIYILNFITSHFLQMTIRIVFLLWRQLSCIWNSYFARFSDF